MKKYISICVLLFSSFYAIGQTSQDRAKAFYQEAVRLFEKKDYSKVLEYCQRVTDELKTTNARIELLRIKSYYELGEIEETKRALSTFSDLPSELSLKQEALSYLNKIERSEKTMLEQEISLQRLLEVNRLEKEGKLTEEERRRKEAEAKSYQAAMSGDLTAIRQFLKDYPTHNERQHVLDVLANEEQRTYDNAILQDEIGGYENYLTLFNDGKHKNVVVKALYEARESEASDQVLRDNSVAGCEKYLEAYPTGKNKEAVLKLYAEILHKEGQQASSIKDYKKVEELYGKYKSIFPSGGHIKSAQMKYDEAIRKIKRAEVIASRSDKTYFMINYATNKSAGLEVGKLKISHNPSVYWGLNYGFTLPGFSSLEELESLDDYAGDGTLKTGFFTSSFGLTMNISYPLWGYAGIGVRYQTYEDGTDSYKIAGQNSWQFFPEFGLKGRIARSLILKAGIQLIKDKPAFQIGIGF